MTEPPDAKCSAAECPGAAVALDRCVGHLDLLDLAGYANDRGNRPFMARNARIDSEHARWIAEVLERAPAGADFRGAVLTEEARFVGAFFPGPVRFDDVTFRGRASFAGARFGGEVFFKAASFEAEADFSRAMFEAGAARFTDATFGKPASFSAARFSAAYFGNTRFDASTSFNAAQFQEALFWRTRFQSALFERASFAGDTRFEEATFGGDASFDEATFSGLPRFDGLTFSADLSFRRARFGEIAFNRMHVAGRTDFSDASFTQRAEFDGATWDGGVSFKWAAFDGLALFIGCDGGTTDFRSAQFRGRCIAELTASSLDIAESVFTEPAEWRVDSAELQASRVRFAEPLTLIVRSGDLNLAGARFAAPATISGGSAGTSAPRLTSVAGTDLANVTLSGIDLSRCRFGGAFNLDRLRIDGPPIFGRTPSALRWDQRMTLAEEHVWRAQYDRRPKGWNQGPADVEVLPHDRSASRGTAAYESATRIQATYRELRKSREDAKDEPGAADFYRGEMEMRRMASRARAEDGRVFHAMENLLLTLYWAISSYGVRAFRAVAALVLLIALASAGFTTVGFGHDTRTSYVQSADRPVAFTPEPVRLGKPGVREAVYYSVESTTSLLREPAAQPLTTAGRAMEIVLRLLGPLLLGIAVFALRSRVKR